MKGYPISPRPALLLNTPFEDLGDLTARLQVEWPLYDRVVIAVPIRTRNDVCRMIGALPAIHCPLEVASTCKDVSALVWLTRHSGLALHVDTRNDSPHEWAQVFRSVQPVERTVQFVYEDGVPPISFGKHYVIITRIHRRSLTQMEISAYIPLLPGTAVCVDKDMEGINNMYLYVKANFRQRMGFYITCGDSIRAGVEFYETVHQDRCIEVNLVGWCTRTPLVDVSSMLGMFPVRVDKISILSETSAIMAHLVDNVITSGVRSSVIRASLYGESEDDYINGLGHVRRLLLAMGTVNDFTLWVDASSDRIRGALIDILRTCTLTGHMCLQGFYLDKEHMGPLHELLQKPGVVVHRIDALDEHRDTPLCVTRQHMIPGVDTESCICGWTTIGLPSIALNVAGA